jgi:DNA-binding transcriptional LysR family regulator
LPVFLSSIYQVDTKRPDLNLLLTLETLLVEQNVTRAAARLNLSQPAVSAQLNRLRDLFGDPLLIPVQRGMLPTAKALELLGPLQQALGQVRSTLANHRHFDPAKAELTLNLAATDYMQVVAVPPLLNDLRQSAPGLRVALRYLVPARLEEQMKWGDVDLAFMTREDAPHGLHVRHLFYENYVLIGRRDHPRLHVGLTLAEYLELDHVIVSLGGGNFVTPVDDALAAQGWERRVVLSAASFLFVPEIVARSDLVALVPRRLVRDCHARLVLIDFPLIDFPQFGLELSLGFEVSMVWHGRNHDHPAHAWLREKMLGLIGENTAAD